MRPKSHPQHLTIFSQILSQHLGRFFTKSKKIVWRGNPQVQKNHMVIPTPLTSQDSSLEPAVVFPYKKEKTEVWDRGFEPGTSCLWEKRTDGDFDRPYLEHMSFSDGSESGIVILGFRAYELIDKIKILLSESSDSRYFDGFRGITDAFVFC